MRSDLLGEDERERLHLAADDLSAALTNQGPLHVVAPLADGFLDGFIRHGGRTLQVRDLKVGGRDRIRSHLDPDAGLGVLPDDRVLDQAPQHPSPNDRVRL
ncbi:hypothetical protein D3C72_1375800 [compost metagenome]